MRYNKQKNNLLDKKVVFGDNKVIKNLYLLVHEDGNIEENRRRSMKSKAKRVLSLFLAASMVISMSACGGTGSETKVESNDTTVTTTPGGKVAATKQNDHLYDLRAVIPSTSIWWRVDPLRGKELETDRCYHI